MIQLLGQKVGAVTFVCHSGRHSSSLVRMDSVHSSVALVASKPKPGHPLMQLGVTCEIGRGLQQGST